MQGKAAAANETELAPTHVEEASPEPAAAQPRQEPGDLTMRDLATLINAENMALRRALCGQLGRVRAEADEVRHWQHIVAKHVDKMADMQKQMTEDVADVRAATKDHGMQFANSGTTCVGLERGATHAWRGTRWSRSIDASHRAENNIRVGRVRA